MESDSTPINDEQQRANRFDLVSRLADDLAHEIKNPLNAIVINLEVLRVRVRRGDSEAALERAAVIEQETRRLHLMIDRLLQLLRPERDDGGPLALDQAFDELLPLIDARARLARNTFDADCGDPVFVAMPRDVFRFALLNILSAVHARLGEDGGGTLTLGCTTGETEVRLTVRAAAGPGAALTEADEGYHRHLGVAADLLRQSGGRLEREGDDVAVILPRI
ncbi:MAG TPA: HAMP domain-containing sensor histidine kinase [Longimicrobiales bacterium]